MNMNVAPYLYCAIDDSVMLNLHNILSICHLWNFAHYFGYQEVINGYALH
jgi:hypothetical protein